MREKESEGRTERSYVAVLPPANLRDGAPAHRKRSLSENEQGDTGGDEGVGCAQVALQVLEGGCRCRGRSGHTRGMSETGKADGLACRGERREGGRK